MGGGVDDGRVEADRAVVEGSEAGGECEAHEDEEVL